MARVVKPAALRQDEILDVAQRHFLQRGYADTPIQLILEEVGIAKGTFYHHYPSKPALLDALIARMVRQSVVLVAPLVDEPGLDAVEKLNAVFGRIGAWKAERRPLMEEMHRALHAEGNAPLLARMQRDSIAALAPMVGLIVRQGREEGLFDTPFPDHAARLLLELAASLSRTLGDALLADPPTPALALEAELDAFHDAACRLLGAAPGSLVLVERGLVRSWFEAAAPTLRTA